MPTRWFLDDDITGTTAARGGLKDLREAVRLGEVRALWSRDQARLLRNLEEFIGLRKELLNAGHEYFDTRHNGWVKLDDLSTTLRAAIDEDRVWQDRKHLMDREQRDAQKGRPPNGRIFGFKAATKDGERTLVQVDEEADRIREAASRVLHGESTTAIARDFDRRLVPTAKGGPWTSATVESLITSTTVAGYRRYQGELVTDGKGQRVRGNWDAILDANTWEDVRSIVDARRNARKASGPSGGFERRRYVLAGLVHCGSCNDQPKMDGTRSGSPTAPSPTSTGAGGAARRSAWQWPIGSHSTRWPSGWPKRWGWRRRWQWTTTPSAATRSSGRSRRSRSCEPRPARTEPTSCSTEMSTEMRCGGWASGGTPCEPSSSSRHRTTTSRPPSMRWRRHGSPRPRATPRPRRPYGRWPTRASTGSSSAPTSAGSVPTPGWWSARADSEARNYGSIPGRAEELRQELRGQYESRQDHVSTMRGIVARVKSEGRTELTAAETREFNERLDRCRPSAAPIDLLDL